MSEIRNRVTGLRYVRASELVPNERNWRTHPAGQSAALRGLLSEVGFVGAVIARELPDGRLELIDGHLRRETAAEEQIPVLVVDLDDAEAAKVLATFDPIAGLAEADTQKLDSLLRDIDTGNEALQEMLAELAKENGLYKTPEVTEDEVPEPPANPVTQPGDLWVLGEHRLLCGDSTNADCVASLFAGGRAGLLFTSPPYAQQRDYDVAKDLVANWDALMQGVFFHAKEFIEPDGQLLVNLGLVHRDNEWTPYWNEWIEWMREQGWKRFGWYVWDQGFGLPGNWNGRLAPSHEFVFHFNRQAKHPVKWVEKKPQNIKPRNHGESTMRSKDGKTKVFSNPGAGGQKTKVPDSVIRVGRQVGSNGHRAQFPVAFALNMLQTWPGLAYEPFAGSGTTIIAAEQLNRRCYGLEISPAYCDVAVERWENLTGLKASRAA